MVAASLDTSKIAMASSPDLTNPSTAQPQDKGLSPAPDPVHQANDALLAWVNEQQDEDTFDAGDRPTLVQLIETLGDTRGVVRLRAAQTLGEIGLPVSGLLQEALLQHQDVVVRRAAAKTLTLIADPEAVPNLVQAAVRDEDFVVRSSAVGALARTGSVAVPELMRLLASPQESETIKGLAAWALSFIGAEAREDLYPAIASEIPAVRAAVVGAIAGFIRDYPEEQAYQILLKALADPDGDVRCEAAAALSEIRYQPAVPSFMAMLQHPEVESRKAAVLALMKLGNTSAIPALEKTLAQESDEGLQGVLKLALGQLEA